ncbi:MAG: flagellar export chaperone FliS [Rubrobacteridae bacterium]|nr:flagellar export chaperone FliS [Rubrobacteridae bacterium]
MSFRANNQYLEMKIQTATPEALVGMLYDGSIKFLNQAINALNAKDWHNAHKNIVRAQNIVSELNVSLDRQKGGEIAENLSKIYGYLSNCLVEANIKKDSKKLAECVSILSDLNGAWREVMKNVKSPSQRVGVRLAG